MKVVLGTRKQLLQDGVIWLTFEELNKISVNVNLEEIRRNKLE